ncbi:MAG TPA: HAD family hydrolase [Caulobacteraceae bacterium]
MSATEKRPPAERIGLLVSDIDGTLVLPDKSLTPAALAAGRRLDAAGVGLTLVSSRPARGMAALVKALTLKAPFAAFNGGSLVAPDGTLISAKRLSPEAAGKAIDLFQSRGVMVWAFADDNWYLTDASGPDVQRERHTVGFDPTLVADFQGVIDRLDKLVGVSDQPDLLADVEAEAQGLLSGQANARRSQTYYLDVTNPQADKGHAVRALCDEIGVPTTETAVIGDQANDMAMFAVAGLSIAMGQGTDQVKAAADFVTAANTEDGFAKAVERFILPRAAKRPGQTAP